MNVIIFMLIKYLYRMASVAPVAPVALMTAIPIELWNIILTFAPHNNAKQLIYLASVHKIFNQNDLDVLKQKYIYDYLICSNPLKKHIYHIYNNLEHINSRERYIKSYKTIYYEAFHLQRSSDMYDISLLKDYLLNKIETKKNKDKFNNITFAIYNNQTSSKTKTNTNYINMLKYL